MSLVPFAGGGKIAAQSSGHHVTLSLPQVVILPSSDTIDLIDSPMYQLPELPEPCLAPALPDGIKELWLRALERPEADLRRQAADAIALAHRRGFPGFDSTIPALQAALAKTDQHPAVRLAAARALVALEARQAAPALFRQAQTGGSDLREIVEPALAQWKFEPIRAVWLERLRDPQASGRALTQAIEGLAVGGDERAVPRLREIVVSQRVAGPVRLCSARALGALCKEGLEKDAEQLTLAAPALGHIAAAWLLGQHRGERALELLKRLADDSEPAAATPALAHLLEIDCDRTLPGLPKHLANADPGMRMLAVSILLRRPSAEHVHLLAERLADAHPGVRIPARRALFDLALTKEWRVSVLAESERMLQGKDWRALEQAAILLTQLDHKPAAPRLVQLLDFPRGEVVIAAAWGLRKLSVPETLPEVTRHVAARLKQAPEPPTKFPPGVVEIVDHEMSQLNQLLGRQKYQAAEGVLRRFIPKPSTNPLLPESRGAAIWALGMIHEKKVAPDLVAAFEERLNDAGSLPPELLPVRYMAAISLGRMGAKDGLDTLRKWYAAKEPSQDPLNNACGWAIEQITGEKMPPPRTIRVFQRDWFLSPNR